MKITYYSCMLKTHKKGYFGGICSFDPIRILFTQRVRKRERKEASQENNWQHILQFYWGHKETSCLLILFAKKPNNHNKIVSFFPPFVNSINIFIIIMMLHSTDQINKVDAFSFSYEKKALRFCYLVCKKMSMNSR